MLLNIPSAHFALLTVKCQRNGVQMTGLYIVPRPYLITKINMSTDREFNGKVSAKINACGPCCSCLVIIVVLVLAFFAFVIR